MAYVAPVRDYQFLFENVFKTDQYGHLKGFADADTATVAVRRSFIAVILTDAKYGRRRPYQRSGRPHLTEL